MGMGLMMRSFSSAILCAALIVFLAGCGGSAGQNVTASSPGITTGSTADIVVRFPASATLASARTRASAAEPTEVRFTGTDTSGNVAFGPRVESLAPVIRLLGVPPSVTSLFVEPLVDGRPVDAYAFSVGLVPGNLFVIVNGLAPSARATAITLSPATASTACGSTQNFSAIGVFPDGSQHDITSTASWSASPSAVATITSPGLVVGTGVGAADITAVLDGLAGSARLTVTPLDTTSTLTSSVIPSVVGQAVTFTATVSPSAPTSVGLPGGTVTFYDGNTSIGSASLAAGTASLVTSTLSAGTHTVTAVYAGASPFNPSTSNPLSQVVKEAGGVSVGSSLNPSVLGDSVTFTAIVTPVTPGGATPTGTITFMDGSTSLGTQTMSGGQATHVTSSLIVGTHSITAVYSGDATFAPGTSTPLSQRVRYGTTTAVVSSLNPSSCGQAVTFTATVSPTPPGTGTPGGTVAFNDGSTLLGTGTLDGSGQATLPVSWLSSNTHSITAVYAGDNTFAGSTSSALSQTVGPAAFDFTNNEQQFTVPAGVTSLTVTVAGAQGGTAVLAGGSGGSVTATISVTPGDLLRLYVGGAGGNGILNTVAAGGYNGGGAGSYSPGYAYAGGGGGASDIRLGGSGLDNRIVIGGGGGGAYTEPGSGGNGGAGGYSVLSSGAGDRGQGDFPGGGGTATGGGAGNSGGGSGSLGWGGNGSGGGAGGGGGFYGGGGGGQGYSLYAGAGGGGSSYACASATSVSMVGGHTGNGRITIWW